VKGGLWEVVCPPATYIEYKDEVLHPSCYALNTHPPAIMIVDDSLANGVYFEFYDFDYREQLAEWE
jgi:hypothetical protein